MSRYIDADKVLEKMRKTFDMQDLYLPIHLKELIIDDMPTADVRENVRSEWVKYDEGDCTCLHCGFVLDDWTQAMFYNYCPNCGCDMRKGEKE